MVGRYAGGAAPGKPVDRRPGENRLAHHQAQLSSRLPIPTSTARKLTNTLMRMRQVFGAHVVGLQLLATTTFVATVSAASMPELRCHPVVPKELAKSTFAPNGDPESVRYTKAYEAFWWNCVMVRAQHLDARCPAICSGTPGATSGCGDGALNAGTRIDALLKQFPAAEVQKYLRRLGSTTKARRQLSGYGYFQDGPAADDDPR